jgi:CRP/FNR family transcriptional regulator/CRP/FNR family cyclic AMP-dependent transcriptional regulator
MPVASIDLHKALGSTHAFCDLDHSQLEVIVALARLEAFQPGDSIVSRHSHECDLLVLLDGEARVLDDDGERIADLGPGAAIGEVALLDQQPRSAEVISKTQSVVAVIPAMELWSLIHKRPDIGAPVLFNIGRVLAARLRSSQR